MKIAVFSVSLPEWTPEEAVQILSDLGYDGVEWRVTDDSPRPTPGFWQGNRCTLPLKNFVEDAPIAPSPRVPASPSPPLAPMSRPPISPTSIGFSAAQPRWARRRPVSRSPNTTGSPATARSGTRPALTTARSRAWRATTA